MKNLENDITLFKKYVKENAVIMAVCFLTIFNCLYAGSESFQEAEAVRQAERERKAAFDAKYITQLEYDKLKNPEKYKNKPLTPLEMQSTYMVNSDGRLTTLDEEITTRVMMSGM